MTSAATQARWDAFKAKREAQRQRDLRIKMLFYDFLGLCEIVGLMVIAWFCLACMYA